MRARRHHVADEPDAGFTLIELLVAMMIITTVLITLMLVQTSAMVTTAQSRQRTQGTAVANQVMEELRALPWLTLSKGLRSSFATASGTDPNVSGGNLQPAFGESISEPLVTASDQVTTMPPLSGAGGTNLTISRDPAAPGIVFSSRTYVTISPDTSPDVRTLTVITTWKRNQKATSGFVVLRSQAYAPAGGCGDASNQPFLGACQALHSSSGAATGPAITVTGSVPGGAGAGGGAALPVLPGTDVAVASISVGQVGVGVSSQQATAIDSTVLFPGAMTTDVDPDVTPATTGGTKITNAASNDVGASGAAPPSPADVTGLGSAGPLTVQSDPLYGLQLVPASGVAGTAKASTTASCTTGVPAGAPCGAASTSAGGTSSVTLSVDGIDSTVASVGAGTAKAFGARFTSAAGTPAVGCTVLSGAGCVSAGASRTVGGASFGSSAWASSAAPSGLVTVTGYTDSASVERGMSQRDIDGVRARSGQIRYWNGTGYTTLNLTGLTSTAVVTPEVTRTLLLTTVKASATVSVTPGVSIEAAPFPLTCEAEGCTVDADSGTVTIAVTYTVTRLGVESSFMATTTLGAARASAAFKAAPGA